MTRESLKSTGLAILKILITVGLLSYVVLTLNIRDLFSTYHLRTSTIVLCVLSLLISQVLAGWRWYLILPTNSLARLAPIIKYSLYASFLNQILIGSIGGDVYKTYVLKKYDYNMKSALFWTAADRVLGLWFMCVIGLICAMMQPSANSFFNTANLFSCGLCFGIALFLYAFNFMKSRISHHVKYSSTVRKLFSFSSEYTFSCTRIIIILGVGLLLTFLLFYPVVLIAEDLKAPWNLYHVFQAMPLIFFIACLPISFAGWGVREGAFIYVLSFWQSDAKLAAFLSICYGCITVISTLPWGLFYVYDTMIKGRFLSRAKITSIFF